MLGLMQLGGALRNWMPAKTQKTARSVRIGQQLDPHRRQGYFVICKFGNACFSSVIAASVTWVSGRGGGYAGYLGNQTWSQSVGLEGLWRSK